MVPRACKNTTLDPSANPFQTLGEASPDPLSVAGGPRPSVVVESRAPTPSLFGASPSPFIGGGVGPIPFAANPPTAKRPRSDTTYLPGFTSETDPKSYWVQRFTAAAAARENPNMDTLVTTIAGFLAEIQADYLAGTLPLPGVSHPHPKTHLRREWSLQCPSGTTHPGPQAHSPTCCPPLVTGCGKTGEEARSTSTCKGATHSATCRHLLSSRPTYLPGEGDHPQRTPPPH